MGVIHGEAEAYEGHGWSAALGHKTPSHTFILGEERRKGRTGDPRARYCVIQDKEGGERHSPLTTQATSDTESAIG